MKHGSDAGYVAGCREDCCKSAHTRARKAWELAVHRGHVFQVSSERSRRKMSALAAMGWPASTIAARFGSSQQSISRVLHRETIRATTAALIDEAYAHFEMLVPEDTIWTRRTKNAALASGAVPPLGWEDIDAGILADQGADRWDPDRFDLEIVEDILQYNDFSIRTTPAEKSEIARRWIASGRSEASLCRLTGWKEGRYTTTHQEAS